MEGAGDPLPPFLELLSGDCREIEGLSTDGAGDDPAMIVVARDSDITDLDPQNFKTDASYDAVANLYEAPLQRELAPGASDTWVAGDGTCGGAVESWRITEEGKRLELRVRPGLTFSDGSQLDAACLKYTMDRAILGPGYVAPLMKLMTVEDPGQVVVKGNLELELQLKHASPIAQELLCLSVLSVMNPGVSGEHGVEDDPWASRWYKDHALGSGPYVLSDWEPGREYTFRPNRRYWRRKEIANSGISVRVIASAEERLAGLRDGSIDLVIGLPPEQLNALERDPDVRLLSFPSTFCKYLGMNNRIPPFDDVKFRRAVSHAIPYGEMITDLMAGHAQSLTSPVPAGMPTHEDALAPGTGEDPDRARELLREASVGQARPVELFVRSTKAEDSRIAERVESGLRKVGIEVEIRTLPESEFFQELTAKRMPFFICETFSWVNEPMSHLMWNLGSNRPKNFTNYANPRVDEAFERGMYELDPRKRAELSSEAQELVVRDAPWALLYQPNWIVATSGRLKGYSKWNDLLSRYRTLYVR
jgi:peptide/nickel transport system substrate-binding protein